MEHQCRLRNNWLPCPRSSRPKGDLSRPVKLLLCCPTFLTFAATAKLVDRQIHKTRTKRTFAANDPKAAISTMCIHVKNIGIGSCLLHRRWNQEALTKPDMIICVGKSIGAFVHCSLQSLVMNQKALGSRSTLRAHETTSICRTIYEEEIPYFAAFAFLIIAASR